MEAKAGVAGGYLNKVQMAALETMVQKKGVSRAQVVKEIIVEKLVAEGLLHEHQLVMVRGKQVELILQPHGNASEKLRDAARAKVDTPALELEGRSATASSATEQVMRGVRRRRRSTPRL